MCVNDPLYEKECIRYIRKLNVPEGYTVEQLSIRNAESMASGYNKAMQQSDAKYKVYLHQDLFIVNKNFIRDILRVFNQEEKIGMIGMVGAPVLSRKGIMWEGERIGTIFTSNIKTAGPTIFGEVKNMYQKVEAVDGLLIATQTDIQWREDKFTGWDFYDVAQSVEFRKNGYKVVVPRMEIPWCLHDDGYMNLETYFRWRDVFLQEYGDMMHEKN